MPGTKNFERGLWSRRVYPAPEGKGGGIYDGGRLFGVFAVQSGVVALWGKMVLERKVSDLCDRTRELLR